MAALALALSLSSVRADPALSAEIRPPEGAGSGITPKNIIFDDDYALYADGMAAHYILLALERAGYAKVLAMVADSSNPYSAPAMAAVNRAFARASIPIGAYQGGVSSASSGSAWSQQIAARFGTPGDVRSNYPDAVTTLRTALAAAANASVTYVSTGFLTNLAALLHSFPDAISPLTGAQLVTAKVVAIMVRPQSGSNATTDPLSYALSLEGAAGTGGYDPLAVHYAVMGLQDNYAVADAGGVNTVNSSTGDNSWAAAGGRASYLEKRLGDSQLANVYNAMVTRATPK
jgi:hypothetical protein